MNKHTTPEKPKSFLEVLRWTPNEARAYLERIRWPNGPVCPNGCVSEVYRFEAKTQRRDKNGGKRLGPIRHLLKCKSCKRQFTATVGLIFEASPIPLNKWMAAVFLMCASKKGVSAHQLHRMLGLSYKAAWFVAHRIRHAMRDKSGPLSGIIEADETFVGGKPRGHRAHRSERLTMSERIKAAWEKKTPVFGILERDGRVRTLVMNPLTKKGAQAALMENIDLGSSRLMTDESPLYVGIDEHLPHLAVQHDREYVTGDGIVHTQGIEGFWSLLKRGLNGTFHHVMPEYLGMYCDEFSFRFNTRKMIDGERFASALQGASGRLTWFYEKRPDRTAS